MPYKRAEKLSTSSLEVSGGAGGLPEKHATNRILLHRRALKAFDCTGRLYDTSKRDTGHLTLSNGAHRELILPFANELGIPPSNVFANRINWQVHQFPPWPWKGCPMESCVAHMTLLCMLDDTTD